MNSNTFQMSQKWRSFRRDATVVMVYGFSDRAIDKAIKNLKRRLAKAKTFKILKMRRLCPSVAARARYKVRSASEKLKKQRKVA